MSVRDNKEDTSVSVRIPESLAAELRTLAQRDCNGVSATIRRLLCKAIAIEQVSR